MQASQESQTSSVVHSFYHQSPPMQVLNNVSSHGLGQGTELSFQMCTDQFFTLESTPAADFTVYNSPSAASVTSNMSPISPQNGLAYVSDHLHHSYDNIYGSSPLSGSPVVDDDSKLMHEMWPECNFDFSGSLDHMAVRQTTSFNHARTLETARHMDLKQLLLFCADTVSEVHAATFSDRSITVSAAVALLDILEKQVSVTGEPLQRLGAYMLEGLRARLLSSGSIIYKKLRCKEPIGSELMSYMHVIYEMCPYYKFAYISANIIISKAMENENRIHIIDFQIAQGSQWISFIQDMSRRPGGPRSIRITGVDDSDSVHARGGSLQMVGDKLAQVAKSCGVPFEFHAAAISGSEVQLSNLHVQPGEALAVNFPYVLHHIPDESVSTINHRDRLLRLTKSLSPKVVILVEQESNTNTATFSQRFRETLDFYTAMFESIDAARPRDDRLRINAEEHCVAKDAVNIIACEGNDRVERHEVFGKWKSRLRMAGLDPIPLSPSVRNAIGDMLKEYSPNYGIVEGNGALYLGWKNRALVTASAWR